MSTATWSHYHYENPVGSVGITDSFRTRAAFGQRVKVTVHADGSVWGWRGSQTTWNKVGSWPTVAAAKAALEG